MRLSRRRWRREDFGELYDLADAANAWVQERAVPIAAPIKGEEARSKPKPSDEGPPMWMAKDKWGDKTRAAKGAKGSPARGQVKLQDGGDEELAPRRALSFLKSVHSTVRLPPPP